MVLVALHWMRGAEPLGRAKLIGGGGEAQGGTGAAGHPLTGRTGLDTGWVGQVASFMAGSRASAGKWA